MNYPCPICGAITVVNYRDVEEGTTLEMAEHCPNGCWECEFHFGHSHERIGDREWDWGYQETPDESKARLQERTEQIATIRQKTEGPAAP